MLPNPYPPRCVPCNLIRAIAGWFTSRLIQLGMLEDDTLNVVAFDGQYNQTTSTHTALAGGYRPNNVRVPPDQRRWWGCVGCRMLSFLVQRNHCWNVMNGVPMAFWNYIRAFACITFVLAAPFVAHWWALASYLLAIAPFAVTEAVSRNRQTPEKVSRKGAPP